MKNILFTLLFSAWGFAGFSQDARPNIIVFLIDDMGWQDTEVPFWKEETLFNRMFRTPNMQILANEGMKFTNAYATPVCTPTRASLITGMNAAHHGITLWTSPYSNTPTDRPDEQFDPAVWNHNGLSPVDGIPHTMHATFLPQLLRDAGYLTVHVGKAHWGSNGQPGSNPLNLGFEVNIGGTSTGQPASYYGQQNYGNIPGKTTVHAVPNLQEYYGTDTFLTDALTYEAMKAVSGAIHRKQPFFLHLGHYAVHTPVQQDPRFFQGYLDRGADTLDAAYASLVEGIDKSLGDLMRFLKDNKIDQNTVVIFMSDNGGLATPGHRSGPPHSANAPLRSGKGSIYEGGIREPMIVKWPGTVQPGSVTNTPVIIEDYFPTLLEIAGVKTYITKQQLDGMSFVNVLKNPSAKPFDRSFIWHLPNKWTPQDGPGINFYSAIRKGNWKLVYHLRTGKSELYNLADDIGESRDVSASNKELTDSLKKELNSYLTKWKAPMPVLKETGKQVEIK